MIRFYKLLYRIGLRPWEELRTLPVAEQISALIDRQKSERQPPHGRALDLGCGSGIWSVELARRGWQVTGIDVVPKAVRATRERARHAGVDATFEEGDVTDLRAAGVGSDFDFVLDFGTVHGLTPEQRAAAGREVSGVAAPGATLLMYAVAPGCRWPLPRGASRADVEAAYVGWSVIDEDEFDLSGAPGALKRGTGRLRRPRCRQDTSRSSAYSSVTQHRGARESAQVVPPGAPIQFLKGNPGFAARSSEA